MIDYRSLVCARCGTNISRRFMNPDGKIIEYLSQRRIPHLSCSQCRKNINSDNGKIPSLMNSKIPFSEKHRDLVIGSILGDGHIEGGYGCKNYSISIKHGLKQERYCIWKAGLFGGLLSSIDYPIDRVRIRTRKHYEITQIASLFLKDGKKVVSENGVSMMGPLAFAIWYLDDGCLSLPKIRSNGYLDHPVIRFSTNAFTSDEIEILSNALKVKIGVQPTKCSWTVKRRFGKKLKSPMHYFGIRLYKDDVFSFLRYINHEVDWQGSGMTYKTL